MGRVYIYPKGKIGLDVEYLLKFVGYDREICFIDDSDKKTSLEHYSEKIQNDDIVLVCSRRHFVRLAKNLIAFNIDYFDGMAFIADEVNNYFNNVLGYKKNNTVGVIIAGPAGSKHRGNIEKILVSQNINVVFLCANEREMHQAKDRLSMGVSLIINEGEILRRLNFCGVLISEGGEKLHADVIAVYISHAFSTPVQSLAYSSRLSVTALRILLENNDYIFASSKKMLDAWVEFARTIYLEHGEVEGMVDYSLGYKVLPLGAPTLDRYVENRYWSDQTDRKIALICLNTDMTDFFSAKNLVDAFLGDGILVIYRPHPMQRNSPIHLRIVDEFADNKNFTYDVSMKVSMDIVEKRPILISDISSMAYTYAIATLTPTILYLNSKWQMRVCGGGGAESFFDDRLHFLVDNSSDCLVAFDEIYSSRCSFEKKIQRYIDDEVYNFGCASEKIAEFIIQLLESKRD